MGIAELERAKYAKAWDIQAYHTESPGVVFVDMFKQIAKPKAGQMVLDIGAGSGAATVKLKEAGLNAVGFDLTDTAWNHPDIPFRMGCAWQPLPFDNVFDFGFCCDVMEHVPTQFTALAISRILDVCDRAFFSISFKPDVMGRAIGEPLHLTVQPFRWWRDTFRELGTLYEARDLLGDGIFYAGR